MQQDPDTEIIFKQNEPDGNDPALWVINESTKDYISINNYTVQNVEKLNFIKSKKRYQSIVRGKFKDCFRYCSSNLFYTHLQNGDKVRRKYLLYSESTGALYCVPCLLFDGVSKFSTEYGFSDWKKAGAKLTAHENSSTHRTCVLNMKSRGEILGRIDSSLLLQMDTEIYYWKNVLTKVVAVVKALSSRGLSFRGDNEKFGSPNNGNFMMAIELISEFDPFLAQHIKKFGNQGKGHTSYTSFHTYEQFIIIMANKVTDKIIKEVQNARYYSISVDSTPDISHKDQLSFIIRYVSENGTPVERFVCFLENIGHKSKELSDAVLTVINSYNIDISYLRGQSYDNAMNMSGIYSGLQARIKEIIPLADYVPCSAHSLNLVGTCAASCCKNA